MTSRKIATNQRQRSAHPGSEQTVDQPQRWLLLKITHCPCTADQAVVLFFVFALDFLRNAAQAVSVYGLGLGFVSQKPKSYWAVIGCTSFFGAAQIHCGHILVL